MHSKIRIAPIIAALVGLAAAALPAQEKDSQTTG